ncbi:multidrug effflux MFS transporter [Camelimonas lactis]|uniref:DHA1 family bicyclomycin/chloramphenicol resistance-like MFS transporter n=1 Tax=Camelimonas lactis TaxID=659006 RepID=A0A4R2GS03_9HYPH|nr:multidrug effflux MFS transporter [Camelimonas lactis]TCO13002.1 DHA1 family bicyclomycin/chloramphenicol resistance-like MFS transporter [Camelimonas lactis]
MQSTTRESHPPGRMSYREFVAFIAALMATNALAIDSMLPALAEIGHDLGLASDNQRQWIITAYLLGFGGAQIFYGPVADRFGRKPVLIFGLGMYFLFGALAGLANTFETMIIARVAQGVGAAATRVLAVSIVRDCYAGRQMARVMSMAMIIFMLVPILAPSFGQAIMLFAPWHWVFGLLAIFGAVVLVWMLLRMPETLHPQDRRSIDPAGVLAAVRQCFASREAVGYMLGNTLALGALFGYINSTQQIFSDVFHAEHLFTTMFALTAGFMAVASLLNARLVERFGMRLLSHTALLGYILVALVHFAVALAGFENLATFVALQACVMFCFGMMSGNFGAMSMQPLGHIAGTASSVQGFVTTVGGALAGFWIGQNFDGTTVPMTAGFAICGVLILIVVIITEKGRLFRPHNA